MRQEERGRKSTTAKQNKCLQCLHISALFQTDLLPLHKQWRENIALDTTGGFATKKDALKHQQTTLAILAKAGDRRALADLMVAMEGYIIDTRRRFALDNVSREDVEQACRLGIMRALPAYDPSVGHFSALASYYIRGEITELADMMVRPVRLPKSRPIRAIQSKVLPEMRRLMNQGLSKDEAILSACKAIGICPDEVYTFLASIETIPIGPNEGNEDRKVYEPKHAPDPTTTIDGNDRARAMQIVANHLDDRAWSIVKMHYFDGMSLPKIGSALGVSRDRASGMLKEALAAAVQALQDQGLDAHALL